MTDESSLSVAENSLFQVSKLDLKEKSVMLVANKADLIKGRVVHPTGQLVHHLLPPHPLDRGEGAGREVWREVPGDLH